MPKIDQEYSLKRTYQQFQMLGHRNMLVTDKKNHVTGVITRKDLMPYNLGQCDSQRSLLTAGVVAVLKYVIQLIE